MDELDDRVAQLCTRIGMLMEDVSLDTLTISGMSATERPPALDRIGAAIDQMKELLAQARALLA